jgi:uncharacterized protein YkwD
MADSIQRGAWPLALAVILLVTPARTDTLWVENAENGYGNVLDGTSASYPLIQSEVVGEGDFAFHLAHPNGMFGQDEWFVLDTTLAIESSTKLFFLSRLGWATSTQIARVQISTNGGATWPTNIYSQMGSGGAGEGAFSLKEINLGAYANQNLRFRFYYDTSGSHFAQTSPGVGWYVDNIQIGDEYEKLPWSIGAPTAHEQQYLEYLNRARADALVEAVRLRDEPDSDIQSAYSFFGIEEQDIVDQFTWYVNNGAIDRFAQPLSFEPHLLQAAQLHSLDQFQHQFQGHVSSSDPPDPLQPFDTLGERMLRVGYNYQSIAENVFSYAESVAHGHAGFDVDWGNTTNTASPYYNPAFNGQGMQNPAGHRINMHNDDFKEVGIGVVNGTNGSVGPQVVTQDFGVSGDVRYITGVVYDDLNGNEFYDIGEGRSGVRVDVDGSGFYAISSMSGGYSVPVPQNGTYEVSFTGGGFGSFVTTATIANGKNYKVDYIVELPDILFGDYNNDGTVNAADYTVYRNRLSGIGGTTLPNDAGAEGVTIDDFNYWKAHFGETNGAGASLFHDPASVPEPASLALIVLGASVVTMALRPRRTMTLSAAP